MVARTKEEVEHHNTTNEKGRKRRNGKDSIVISHRTGSVDEDLGGVLSGFTMTQKRNKRNRIDPISDFTEQIEDREESKSDAPVLEDTSGSASEINEAINRRKGKIILPPLEIDESVVRKKMKDMDESILSTADTLSNEDYKILSKWKREFIRSEPSNPKSHKSTVNNRKKSFQVHHSINREITDPIDFEEFSKITEDIYAGRGLFLSHEDKELDKFTGWYDKKRQGPSKGTLIRLYNKLMKIQREEWKTVKDKFSEASIDMEYSLIYGFMQVWTMSRYF